MKLLWSGTWSSGSITVPELPYYNIIYINFGNTNVGALLTRNVGDETNSGNIFTGIGGHSWNTDLGFVVTRLECTSATAIKKIGAPWYSSNGSSFSGGGNQAILAIYGVL